MLIKIKSKLRKSTLYAYHRLVVEEYWWRRQQFKKTPFGFLLKGPESLQTGVFEPDEVEMLKKYLPQVDIFLDIGANIGYYTCISRNMSLQVVAIEPLAENLRVLYQNLNINNWNDVEVWPIALGSAPGIVKLYGKGTAASLIKYREHDEEKWEQLVAVNSLDNILNSRFTSKKIFVKMDVEGMELGVLSGAQQTLQRQPKPLWLVENPILLPKKEKNPNFLKIFEIFWQNGYETYTVEKEKRKVIENDVQRWFKSGHLDSVKSANWLFLPRP
jgi:FkbM family methyltransferase